jgi:hypothetical protein
VFVRTYPYAFHVALDGSGLNGLEGRAGVCVLRYDPDTGDHAYKVTYFTGASGGHGASVSPERTSGFLGNVGQHLLFYDPVTLEELDRVSTMRFEVADHALRGSTHVVWLDDVQFLTAIGEQFWRFDVNRLTKADPIAQHGLKLPHALKRTASGRYMVYGGMDHPDTGEAREVGILDLVTGAVRRVPLPTTCWHVTAHRDLDVFYALSFRVVPGGGTDWHQWGMAFLREYAYEIDAETGQVLRHWTVVLVSLDDMATTRFIDERPTSEEQWMHSRSAASTVVDAFARGNVFTDSNNFVAALQVSRGSLIDGIYACQLSADQSLLFTANRGRNHITVYDYPSLRLRDRFPMPDIQEFDPAVPSWADPRLGFHHSTLLSPPAPTA